MLLSISVSHTGAQSCIYIGGVCVCVCVRITSILSECLVCTGQWQWVTSFAERNSRRPLLVAPRASLCPPSASSVSLVLPQILQHWEGSVPLLAIKAQTNISKTLNSSLKILLLTTAATNTVTSIIITLVPISLLLLIDSVLNTKHLNTAVTMCSHFQRIKFCCTVKVVGVSQKPILLFDSAWWRMFKKSHMDACKRSTNVPCKHTW